MRGPAVPWRGDVHNHDCSCTRSAAEVHEEAPADNCNYTWLQTCGGMLHTFMTPGGPASHGHHGCTGKPHGLVSPGLGQM